MKLISIDQLRLELYEKTELNFEIITQKVDRDILYQIILEQREVMRIPSARLDDVEDIHQYIPRGLHLHNPLLTQRIELTDMLLLQEDAFRRKLAACLRRLEGIETEWNAELQRNGYSYERLGTNPTSRILREEANLLDIQGIFSLSDTTFHRLYQCITA